MKFFLLFFFFCFNAWSGRYDFIQVFNDLSGGPQILEACEVTNPNSPPYCQDLYGYICRMERPTSRQETLDNRLNEEHWRRLPRNCTHQQFNEVVSVTHLESEQSVFQLAGISRDEVRMAFADSKSAIMQFITSSSLIPGEHRTAMANNINSTRLLYGREYVETLVQHAKRQHPNAPEEQIRAQANQLYMSVCGNNGLEVNAFYEGGNMVICPGLLISMSDMGGSKEEMLAALRFTLGHELGHAIDTGTEFASTYERMGQCYQENKENIAWNEGTMGEISADYWGVIALTNNVQRINTRVLGRERSNAADNARILGYALDGFCSTPPTADAPHPPGSYRVREVIADHPYVVDALDCYRQNSVYCGLQGAYTYQRQSSAQ